MKKTLYYFAALFVAAISLTSCEKDLKDFDGDVSLYFDARFYSNVEKELWPHRLHTAVAFGETMNDEITVRVPVRATGEKFGYDRPYTIEIVSDSTTANLGAEFDGLEMNRVIKAGELTDTIKFTAHRTKAIDNDTLRLQLRIVPNEHFKTNFNFYQEDSPYYYLVDPWDHKSSSSGDQANRAFDINCDANIHNIFIYDTMVQPAGWWGSASGGTWGKFSAKKMRLIMEICGCDLSAFESMSTMPSARATSYGEKVGKYLIEQAKKGRDHAVLDEDGTMMWVNYCTTGDVYYRWGQGYKPEDCSFYNQ